MLVALRVLLHALQRGARLLEIEVVEHHASRGDLLGDAPPVDARLHRVDHAVARTVGNGRVARQPGVAAGVIGQHQKVRAVAVLEVIGDAFVLHETTHEGEVALLVLHAILPGTVVAGKPLLELKAVFAQHIVEYLGHALVLEDAAVRGAREVPEPGLHQRAVDVVAAGFVGAAHELEAHHGAVEKTRCAAVLQLDGERCAQQRLQIEAEARADHVHLELEKLREAFVPTHGAEFEVLCTECGVNLDGTRHSEFPWPLELVAVASLRRQSRNSLCHMHDVGVLRPLETQRANTLRQRLHRGRARLPGTRPCAFACGCCRSSV